MRFVHLGLEQQSTRRDSNLCLQAYSDAGTFVAAVAHDPTCPICQRLLGELPAFAQRIEEFAPSLLFATVDATKNEIDAAGFEAPDVYPCIALFVWDDIIKTHAVVHFPWSDAVSADMLSLSKYMPNFLKKHASVWSAGLM